LPTHARRRALIRFQAFTAQRKHGDITMITPHTFAVIRVQRVHLNEDYKLANAASNAKLFGAGDPNSFDVAHEDQTICTVLVKSAGDIFRKIRMWHAIFDLRFLGVDVKGCFCRCCL
jgi:hypothetical protein